MKKIMALAFALLFAVANAAETYVASEKITQQVLSGDLSQTVYAGDEIKPVTILYENTGLPKMLYQNIHRRTFWKILDCRKGGWALDVKLRER